MAKGGTEKKEDEIKYDATIVDLQVTNLFLSMRGKDAIIKLWRLMSPRNLMDTPYKDNRLATENYVSPKERVVTAERAKFLFVIQGAGESNIGFLARLREESSYCDFEKHQTAASPEEELFKIKLISGLRDPEAKLSLLDGIKTKSSLSNSGMTKSFKLGSQTMNSASSSSSNKPYIVKEAVRYNFTKIF